MKCVNVRGKPFEGFEIQNQRTSFLLLWSVFYFYILKPLLSYAQCSAEVSHRCFRGLKITKFSSSPNHGGRQFNPLHKFLSLSRGIRQLREITYNVIFQINPNQGNCIERHEVYLHLTSM